MPNGLEPVQTDRVAVLRVNDVKTLHSRNSMPLGAGEAPHGMAGPVLPCRLGLLGTKLVLGFLVRISAGGIFTVRIGIGHL